MLSDKYGYMHAISKIWQPKGWKKVWVNIFKRCWHEVVDKAVPLPFASMFFLVLFAGPDWKSFLSLPGKMPAAMHGLRPPHPCSFLNILSFGGCAHI